MAERCVRAGVGRSLARDEIEAERMLAEVAVLLQDARYTERVEAVA